jgi:hypothetical protein
LANTSDPILDFGLNIYDVLFDFDDSINLLTVGLPSGWDSNYDPTEPLLDYDYFFGWSGEPYFDILPQSSLQFSLVFDVELPQNYTYEVTFSNPVPAPSTILLLSSGLACLIGFRLRKKGATETSGLN